MITIYALETGERVRNVGSIDGEDMTGHGWADCPEGWERMRWDETALCWVDDAAIAARIEKARIDAMYRAEHGDGAKREAHIRKAGEARLYLKFQDPDLSPLLAAEADATGVPLAELATIVIAKDAEWIARETARRAAKTERNI